MSTCEVFELPELELEPYELREALRCVLHTVLFQRALGLARPRDVPSELFEGVSYATGGGAAGASSAATFAVEMGFYERRTKQVWFSKSEERVYWEKWRLKLSVVRPGLQGELVDGAARARRHAAAEAGVLRCMERVLELADARKDHLPPVVSSEVVCFPFDITTPSATDSSFGMDMLKKFVSQSPPSMLQ
eukprot:PRCOL_00006110-RA